MAAFRAAEHTAVSREVLQGIEKGTIDAEFKALAGKAGAAVSPGKILVNNTAHMQEVLSTLVHEGQHALDMGKGVIPLPGAANAADVAHAELRAFTSAIDFAKKNQFMESGLSQLFAVPRGGPMLHTIMRGYRFQGELLDTLLTDRQASEILNLFFKQKL